MVVLSAPSVIELLTASERQTQGLSLTAVVNPARLRERMLSDEGEQRRQELRLAKAGFVARIQQRGLTVRFQTETALNAIMLESATEEDLEWLRAQPGVKYAVLAGRDTLHLDTAASLIGAPQAWTLLGGQDQAGRGVKVGIVDSGVENVHPMFSDAGFTAPSGFPKFDNTTNQGFTNNKVIVAKNYVCPLTGTCAAQVATADRTATDGVGHGTLVASIIAGRPVNAPTGVSVSGIAPGAFVGNYKVFGGSNSGEGTGILTAFDDAIRDGMEIVNYSGGGRAPDVALWDPRAELIRNGAAAGVLFVVSAGNCGPQGGTGCASLNYPGENSISSPASSSEVIAAGASTNSHSFRRALTVLGPGSVPANLQAVSFAPSSAPAFAASIEATPIVDVVTLDPSRVACTASLFPPGSLTGKLVLIPYTFQCSIATKVNNLAAGGAVGVVISDDVPEPLFTVSTTGATIPSVLITFADGANLAAFIAQSNGNASARIDLYSLTTKTADMVSGYSSRGPANDMSIKPDLVAPGDIFGAGQSVVTGGSLYSPARYVYAQGTSFASPMTAGSAAVVKQARPSLTPRQIKSALVNNTSPLTATEDGATLGVMQMGSGRLNLPAALATTLVADPVSLSFGLVQTTGSAFNKSLAVQLKNVGASSETFAVSVDSLIANGAVRITPDQTSVTIAAGATSTVNVALSNTGQAAGVYEGFVVVKSQSTSTQLRIAYWVCFGLPQINTLTDGASFGKAVAPGQIVSLFGSNLSAGTGSATALPLPKNIAHARVIIVYRSTSNAADSFLAGGQPVFFASPGQLNLQLSYTMTADRDATIYPFLDGVIGAPLVFRPVAAAPAIFSSGSGSNVAGTVTHADGSMVTAASPAADGEVLVIYGTGLGTVSPAAGTGIAAPSTPISNTTATPVVLIGGQQATVQFSGLTPGGVGLYQVNVVMPSGLTSGPVPLTITISGATSNSVTTFAK